MYAAQYHTSTLTLLPDTEHVLGRSFTPTIAIYVTIGISHAGIDTRQTQQA
jgi:hypothetical protein